MWHVIKEATTCKDSLVFFIPVSCPINMAHLCSQALTKEERSSFPTPGKEAVPEKIASYTGTLHIKEKRKDGALVVESKVRRSERL